MNYNPNITLLTGAALGASAMYLLDPGRGGRRRALIRDKVVHAAHKTGDAIDATSRDVAYRTQGLAAELRGRFSRESPPDEVLAERVRAALGRVVSHPHAIDVTANEGCVCLTGPILASEVDELISIVGSIRGVAGVENQLEVHDSPGNTPALQGGRTRPGQRWALLQDSWSPTTKLMVGLASAVALGVSFAAMSGVGSDYSA